MGGGCWTRNEKKKSTRQENHPPRSLWLAASAPSLCSRRAFTAKALNVIIIIISSLAIFFSFFNKQPLLKCHWGKPRLQLSPGLKEGAGAGGACERARVRAGKHVCAGARGRLWGHPGRGGAPPEHVSTPGAVKTRWFLGAKQVRGSSLPLLGPGAPSNPSSHPCSPARLCGPPPAPGPGFEIC